MFLILPIISWGLALLFAYGLYSFFEKNLVKLRSLEAIAGVKDQSEFFKRMRTSVSSFSGGANFGFGRAHDIPGTEDLEEYYDFFHYQFLTTLRERLRGSSAGLIAALIGLIFTWLFPLFIAAEADLYEILSLWVPLSLVALVTSFFALKLFKCLKQQLEVMTVLDTKFADFLKCSKVQ